MHKPGNKSYLSFHLQWKTSSLRYHRASFIYCAHCGTASWKNKPSMWYENTCDL